MHFQLAEKKNEILHHNFMALTDIMLCMCSKQRVQCLINMEKLFSSQNWLIECMYVCIEVALCRVHMGSGVQLGLEEGPIKSGSNVPTP